MKRFVILSLTLVGACIPRREPQEIWYAKAEMICRQTECTRCHGRGDVPCPPCKGTGQIPCDDCKNGTVICRTCGGDGYYKGKPCKTCRGKGSYICPKCGGDSLANCDTCKAQGRIHCLEEVPLADSQPAPEDQWPPIPSKPPK